MNELLPNDELLTAYLDGELTPREREIVERAVRQGPETRRLLDELRRTRACLQDLPRYQLGPDFARQVLRQAQRAMLLGDAPRASGEVRLAAARRFTASSASWLRVAAAVMVLVPALVLMVIATRDPRPEARSVALGEGDAASFKDGINRPAPEGAKTAHFDAPREEAEQRALMEKLGEESPDGGQHRRGDRTKAGEGSDHLEKNGMDFTPAAPSTAVRGAPGGGGAGGGGMALRKAPVVTAPSGGAAPPAESSGTMVVHVAVTAETWRGGLGKLLGREKDLKLQELPRTVTFGYADADQPSDEKKAASAAKLDALAESSSQVGVWNVEAAPGELEGLLVKLREQAEARQHVLALAVQPPAQAKDAAPWAAYNFAAEFWDQKQLQQLQRQAGQELKEPAGEMFFGGALEKAEFGRESEKLKKGPMDKRASAAPAAPGGLGGATKKQLDDPVKLRNGRSEKAKLDVQDGKLKTRENRDLAPLPPAPSKSPPGAALKLASEQAPRVRALFIFYVPANAASPSAAGAAPTSPAAAKEKQK